MFRALVCTSTCSYVTFNFTILLPILSTDCFNHTNQIKVNYTWYKYRFFWRAFHCTRKWRVSHVCTLETTFATKTARNEQKFLLLSETVGGKGVLTVLIYFKGNSSRIL